MATKNKLLPCNYRNLTKVFSFTLVLFSFIVKKQNINFAVENEARKAIKTFDIRSILLAQYVRISNLQSATSKIIFLKSFAYIWLNKRS